MLYYSTHIVISRGSINCILWFIISIRNSIFIFFVIHMLFSNTQIISSLSWFSLGPTCTLTIHSIAVIIIIIYYCRCCSSIIQRPTQRRLLTYTGLTHISGVLFYCQMSIELSLLLGYVCLARYENSFVADLLS